MLAALRVSLTIWAVGDVVLGCRPLFSGPVRPPPRTPAPDLVHMLEQGRLGRRVKVILLLSAIAFVTYLWFFKEGNGFKGTAH